jgi:hypothetical protein
MANVNDPELFIEFCLFPNGLKIITFFKLLLADNFLPIRRAKLNTIISTLRNKLYIDCIYNIGKEVVSEWAACDADVDFSLPLLHVCCRFGWIFGWRAGATGCCWCVNGSTDRTTFE